MLNRLTQVLGAAVLATGVATSASAVTVNNPQVLFGPGSVTATSTNFDFNWTGTPFTASVEFSVAAGEVATFTLSNYVINGGGSLSDVTGFTVDELLGGSATRLTNKTSFCSSAAGDVSGNCDLIGPTGATNSNGPFVPGNTVISLTAGDYLFGIFDSSTPTSASVSFSIDVQPVPLPAGGLLLLSGFGAAALMRRRRKAA